MTPAKVLRFSAVLTLRFRYAAISYVFLRDSVAIKNKKARMSWV